ncbi:hypothetical protein E2C01_081744 [Portunus trituberculatus]|uniref:Uncharacterized protein n=1 Tax=Portunus trituberculatus TaxID=210409 RepID=A0A5B7IWQ1_PORTR|nr:hypothetical protein [Portunus trituberculatus]
MKWIAAGRSNRKRLIGDSKWSNYRNSPECQIAINPKGKEIRKGSTRATGNNKDSQCLIQLQLE